MKLLSRITPFFAAIVLMTSLPNSGAQSPTPIIVQAATSVTAPTSTSRPAAAAAVDDIQSLSGAIKLLEQIKAANEDVLSKQKAALEKLDELKQNADQLQIFAKRG